MAAGARGTTLARRHVHAWCTCMAALPKAPHGAAMQTAQASLLRCGSLPASMPALEPAHQAGPGPRPQGLAALPAPAWGPLGRRHRPTTRLPLRRCRRCWRCASGGSARRPQTQPAAAGRAGPGCGRRQPRAPREYPCRRWPQTGRWGSAPRCCMRCCWRWRKHWPGFLGPAPCMLHAHDGPR
jgi:hypothetical protein